MKRLMLKIFRYMVALEQNDTYNTFRKKYQLDPTFRFNGKDILMYGDGGIYAGADSYVGEYSTWQAAEGYSIRIGKGCMISHNVRCYTQTSIADHDFSISPKPDKFGNVTIEDFVWIGANVFINPGVTIGQNAVVGANSVVTKNVPANTIVGGVPAKEIRIKKI